MRKRGVILAVVLAILAGWWIVAAPRPEIAEHVADSIDIDPATSEAAAAVDHSDDFAAQLEQIPSDVPPYDDAILINQGATALVTAHDGQLWTVDLVSHAAQPVADVPLMAWGIHEAPDDALVAYFCSAGSYGDRPPGEEVGLYRIRLDTMAVDTLAVRLPVTEIDHDNPVVYAADDAGAPTLRAGNPERSIAVCDNLEVSADGRRIYFSEPFAYADASVDDAIDEAIALARNGRLWLHDLDTDTTSLVAEGFHFINGVLYDPHPGALREDSVIVTQTSLFTLTRFYVRGPRAGSYEVVIEGLPGTPDGMDRDAQGRIWLAMFLDRSPILTWAHANAWIKPLIMRVPTGLLLGLEQKTGVVVVSADGTRPLYSAFHGGDGLYSIASAVPTPGGIYLANVSLDESDRGGQGIQRLRWPASLPPPH